MKIILSIVLLATVIPLLLVVYPISAGCEAAWYVWFKLYSVVETLDEE